MPINQLPEWYAQKARYEAASGIESRIIELEKLISLMRKHKGTEKMLAQFHSKLAKLREEKERQKSVRKKSRKVISVPKQGFQIAIAGFTKSGKSTFLKKMTNANPKIAPYGFTTKEPEVGMLDFGGAQVQMVEVPALGTKQDTEMISIVRNADGVILLYNNDEELKQLEKILDKYSVSKPTMKFSFGEYPSKKEVFEFFKLIRVYTKEPGKKAVMDKPLVIAEGTNVLDAAKEIHKDFAEKLNYACVWGSSKFPGQRVEKEYKLKDGDIVEFHI